MQESVAPLHTDIVGKMGVGGVKAAMDAVGLFGGPVRPPLSAVSDRDADRVRRLLEKQRRFTLALVDAVEPVTRKFGARKGPKRKSPEPGRRPSKAPAKVDPGNRSERQDVS